MYVYHQPRISLREYVTDVLESGEVEAAEGEAGVVEVGVNSTFELV